MTVEFKKTTQFNYVNYDYSNIRTKWWLIEYSRQALKNRWNANVHHSWTKDIVMNAIYSSDLTNTEKLVLIFLYDLIAHQDVLPYIEANNRIIAQSLQINEWDISTILKKFEELNIISRIEDLYENRVILFNENINNWNVAYDSASERIITRLRKTLAVNNVEVHEMLRSEWILE